MAFIDNVRGKLTQASQTTVQKAKDLSEIARLNSVISSTEKQIQDMYSKIGHGVFFAYRDNPLPEVADLLAKADELHRTVDDCKAQIKAIQTADCCPQCGAKVGKGMVFCSGCGYRLQAEEQPPVDEPPMFCTNCGARIYSTSKFCNSCGHKVG